jgi:N-methylhydantoinase A
MKVLGIDTGGTFTDMVVLDQETGEIERFKVPSTPEDPSQATVNCLREMFRDSGTPEEVASFSHGTTLGTNLLVQGKGARVGILVTEGFSGINDVWQVPRFGADMYKIYVEKTPFVLPRFRAEIRERVDATGKVVTPLDKRGAVRAVRELGQKGVDSIAVVLLFSFLNPRHELELGEIIRKELPGCAISLSSQVVPQIREYPRLSTTVANARMAPTLGAYFIALEQRLQKQGIKTKQIYIMQSNGGVAKISNVVPVTTVYSGPCAGAQAGVVIGGAAGFSDTVSIDIGGTSTDISLGEGGKILEKTSGQLGDWELATPMLMLHSIGAGGGTIAWLDQVGSLQVGPNSAGADPGPVCYDKGGTEPTVTDANVLLGILHPEHLLGGRVKLNREKAAQAVAKLGRRLGLKPLQTAEGIVRIINIKMVEGIRAAAAERGYDLRTFALVAFGGAGPVHAARLAPELGMRKVVVPPMPGLTSALGLLLADLRRDYVRSRLRRLSEMKVAELNGIFAELREQAEREIIADGFAKEQIRLNYVMDLRYQGQGYELTIPVGSRGRFTPADLERIRRHFDDYHEQLFGHSNRKESVEAVSYRLRAMVVVPKATLKRYRKTTTSPQRARTGERQICFDSRKGMVRCPIYDRSLLAPGHTLRGPAIVEQFDSTTVVYPGQTAEVDSYKNLVLTVG